MAKKPKRAPPTPVLREPEGDDSPARKALLAWMHGALARKGLAIAEHVLVTSPRGVDAYSAATTLQDLGPEGLRQAAAILTRAAGDDELVAVLEHVSIVGVTVGGRDVGARGLLLLARSKNGECFAQSWRAVGAGHTIFSEHAPEWVDQNGGADWTLTWAEVDPAVEATLAARRLPGAKARPSSPTHAVFATAASPARPAPAPPSGAVEPPEEIPSWIPWDAARRAFAELRSNSVGDECAVRAFSYAAPPLGLRTRPLDELLAHGWTTEEQAVYLAELVVDAPDLGRAIDAFRAARLPRFAWLRALAKAPEAAARRGDTDAMVAFADELTSAVDDASRPLGGPVGLVRSVWPARWVPGAELASAAIACVTAAAYWRMAADDASSTPASPAARQAIVDADALRDGLLTLAEIPDGEAASRLARAAAVAFGPTAPALGEPRLERWIELIEDRAKRGKPERARADLAAYHAALLHSAARRFELVMARREAQAAGDDDGWRPEEVSPVGLLQPALRAVANQIVAKAAGREPDDRRLALLVRARDVAPWHDLSLACFDEERFRRGAWDERLLGDLLDELRRAPGLAPAAELLAVAERLGAPRIARVALKRALAAAERTPHAWILAVRALFARPHLLAEAERVAALERSAPGATFDAGERAVFALYGAEPAEAVAGWRRALASQRDALAWAALVAEVEQEDAAAARAAERELRKHGPAVPTEPSADAPRLALEALRWWIDRCALADDTGRRLEAHASDATALVSAGAVAVDWVAAVSAPDTGLVATLARVRREPEARRDVDAALEKAETACAAARASAWLSEMELRLSAAWPLLASSTRARDFARRVDELRRSAAMARADEHLGIERRLTDLLAELSGDAATHPGAIVDEAAVLALHGVAADDELDGDAFVPMTVAPDAIERSRRDLATPEWALGEGLRQVAFYNAARGRRDLKMLRGTRDGDAGALWELRHRDGRNPVRVVYRYVAGRPEVCAVVAKQDDEHQRRMIERIRGW